MNLTQMPQHPWPLPDTIRARSIDNANGLHMHVLEAGDATAPLILLLHGFPELSYSWRRVMPALADAGYYVVAPDQRGFGLTSGSDNRFEGDVVACGMFNLTRDIMGLLSALGKSQVACVVGHDFGSAVAAWCTLIRPDVFKRMVLMSAPFAGAPALTGFNITKDYPTPQDRPPSPAQIDAALESLDPPRRHYHSWYSTPFANAEMMNPPQGLHNFLRAYFHYKSADFEGNKPYRLENWDAAALGEMPTYYIMEQRLGMAESVAPYMPNDEQIAACEWLTEADLAVYTAAYTRTTFQGGFNWYRCRTIPEANRQLQTFAGRTIDVPSMFLSGTSDWGTFQRPGDLERMRDVVCTDMRVCDLVDGAGHWVQQENPANVVKRLIRFVS